MKFDKLIPRLISSTQEIGKMIMLHYKTNLDVKTKIDETPITIVDQKAHQLITKTLLEITPKTPILSEESERIDYSARSNWEEYWLIDPLDGTRDFIEETGEFCICIAYIKDHRPIFGFIFAPLSQTYYFTNDQFQAVKVQNNKTTVLESRIKQHPLEVVIGHHSSNNQHLQSHLKTLGDVRINRLGSALKFCKIAEGVFDYYPRFGPCSEWDTAAGECILEAAGGHVVGVDNKPLQYNTKESLNSPIFFASGKA